MVNFNPHRILQKDLTKTRRWRDHAMKRARFREFIFIFQAAIRYSSEGIFIFNRVIDGYCARGSMTAPNISKLDENARSHRGESATAENRVIRGTGSNDASNSGNGDDLVR